MFDVERGGVSGEVLDVRFCLVFSGVLPGELP